MKNSTLLLPSCPRCGMGADYNTGSDTCRGCGEPLFHFLDEKIQKPQDVKEVIHYEGILIKSIRVEIEHMQEPTSAELRKMADEYACDQPDIKDSSEHAKCEQDFIAGFKEAIEWMKGDK